MVFADIIVDISVKSLDRPFQYLIPEELEEEICIGMQVKIPFGKGNRVMKGFVIGISNQAKFDIARTKKILGIEKQGVVAESHLLSLAYWMKEHYGGTINDSIKAVMPVKREIKEKRLRQVLPAYGYHETEKLFQALIQKHQTARARVLEGLLGLGEEKFNQGLAYELLTSQYKATAAVLKQMQDKGYIKIDSKQIYRNPYSSVEYRDKTVKLNTHQLAAKNRICQDYREGKHGVYLLHGVTGSGKTEVYMHCMEEIIRDGGQAIMLIPEIALTYQTVNRFYARFGDKVSVIHSRLSEGERYDQYMRAKNGEISIMIGPRSALFAPFMNLKLIVIDEEHETSYQSESVPKYHAREVAIQRGKMLGASIVLGSATPSIEANYQAIQGESIKLSLPERTGKASLPTVSIVDLREELTARNYSIFSRELSQDIHQRLQHGEQIMLFLNRRGYAGFVSCRKCGEVVGCPHCSVSLKPHMYRGKVNRLLCHYCGHEVAMPEKCPSCGSKYIGTFGLGTEQVEEMAKKQFPTARILRMDADTTGTKDSYERILSQFDRGEADILIGTQMIVKGHDFAGVTLVGILAADLSLNVGDYRSAERTFQLLAQAAGRAGRGEKPGKVVLQTYKPEHYSVVCAANQDYDAFYNQEILIRQMLQYPPISNILGVLSLSRDFEHALKVSEMIAERVKGLQNHNLLVLGPCEAAIGKKGDVYRQMVYIKAKDNRELINIKNDLEMYLKQNISMGDVSVLYGFND